jgi:primosomal protein N' (replication factor Y)
MSDEMQCFACGKKYPLATNCQNCNGTNFKTIGSGVRGLFAQLKKLFPTAKSLLIEGGTVQADPDEYDMVVATTAIFHSLKPRFREFDLAVEALLGAGTGRAGVYAIEETARIIRGLNTTVNAGGRLFIQTYDKANPALLAIADLEKFALQELNERKIFSYPPSSKLVTLIGAGKDENKIFIEAKKLEDDLKKSELIAVSEPTWNEPKFFRGKYRIKISAKAAPRQNTDFLVKYLPNGWNAEIREL